MSSRVLTPHLLFPISLLLCFPARARRRSPLLNRFALLSRSRKIRCDGARPMCYNCRHRVTGICEYDAVPKRRGPDRTPGSRQRPGRTDAGSAEDTAAEASSSGRSRRKVVDGAGDSGDQGSEPSSLNADETKANKSRRRRNASAGSSTALSVPSEGPSKSRARPASVSEDHSTSVASKAIATLASAPNVPVSEDAISQEIAHANLQPDLRDYDPTSHYHGPIISPRSSLGRHIEIEHLSGPVDVDTGGLHSLHYDHFHNLPAFDERSFYNAGPSDPHAYRAPYLHREHDNVGSEALQRLATCATEQGVLLPVQHDLPRVTDLPASTTTHSPAHQPVHFVQHPYHGVNVYQPDHRYNIGTYTDSSTQASIHHSTISDTVIDPRLVSTESPDSFFSRSTPEQNQPIYPTDEGMIPHASISEYPLSDKNSQSHGTTSRFIAANATNGNSVGGIASNSVGNATVSRVYTYGIAAWN
jgi:hypothetical protein